MQEFDISSLNRAGVFETGSEKKFFAVSYITSNAVTAFQFSRGEPFLI